MSDETYTTVNAVQDLHNAVVAVRAAHGGEMQHILDMLCTAQPYLVAADKETLAKPPLTPADGGLREALAAYTDSIDFTKMRGDVAILGVLDVLAAHPTPTVEEDKSKATPAETATDEHVHWEGEPGEGPTSLHGNGAASFARTSGDEDDVDCSLCLTLLDDRRRSLTKEGAE